MVNLHNLFDRVHSFPIKRVSCSWVILFNWKHLISRKGIGTILLSAPFGENLSNPDYAEVGGQIFFYQMRE